MEEVNWHKFNGLKVRMYRTGLGIEGEIDDEEYKSLKTQVYKSRDFEYIAQLRCISKWVSSSYKEFTITNLAFDFPKTGTETIDKLCLGCSEYIRIKLRSKKSRVNVRNGYIIFLLSLFFIFGFIGSNPFGDIFSLLLAILLFGALGFFFVYPEQLSLKNIKFKSHEIMLPQDIDNFV